MAYVTANKRISHDHFMLTVSERNDARAGQFCMLRAWEGSPLLGRPISLYDRDYFTMTFLFRAVGVGTELLAHLRTGDDVRTGRVLGNGFPDHTGRVALVGGGTGIAPIHLAAKRLKHAGAAAVEAYLGFSAEAMLVDEFDRVTDKLTLDVGGFITDKIDPSLYDCVMACGPEPMLAALHEKCDAAGVPMYMSLERRMGCGTGLCYGCSVKTVSGMRKVCHDGPVFRSSEIFGGRDER